MRWPAVIAIAVAAGCVTACADKNETPSCAERVEKVAAQLAHPRSPEKIREGAPPKLAADLDAVMQETDEAERATEAARRLEKAVVGCAEVVAVFGSLASDTPERKDEILRREVPPSLRACRCVASPEHVGGLVEAILGHWGRTPGAR